MKIGRKLSSINESQIVELICCVVILAACLKLPNGLQDLGNVVYLVALFVSAIYLFWSLIVKRRLFKGKYNIGAFVLIGTFVVSLVVNHSVFLVRNIRAVACGIIFFYLLVQQSEKCSKEIIEKRVHVINMIIIVSTMIYSVFTVCFIFLKTQIYLTNFSGSTIVLGWNVGRIMGIYAEGNLAGLASMLSFAIGLIEIRFCKARGAKINKIVYVNQVLQFICVALSSSRCAYIALLAMIFVYTWGRLSTQNIKKYRVLLATIGIEILVGIILIMSSTIFYICPKIALGSVRLDVRKGTIEYIEEAMVEEPPVSILYRFLTGKQAIEEPELEPGNHGTVSSEENVIPNAEQEPSMAENTDANDEGKGDVIGVTDVTDVTVLGKLDEYSSGRITIWKSGIERLKHNLLFGEGLYNKENQQVIDLNGTGQEIVVMNYVSMHNDYVQAYVCGGIVGGTVFVLYLFVLLYRIIKNCAVSFKAISNEKKMNIYSLAAFVVGMLTASMLVCVLYYDIFNFGAIFWIYFGFLLSYSRVVDREEEDKLKSIKTE